MADLARRAEGAPLMVMTEAMACGTPVIDRPNGSVPEAVADDETGFIAESVEAMVTGYERV